MSKASVPKAKHSSSPPRAQSFMTIHYSFSRSQTRFISYCQLCSSRIPSGEVPEVGHCTISRERCSTWIQGLCWMLYVKILVAGECGFTASPKSKILVLNGRPRSSQPLSPNLSSFSLLYLSASSPRISLDRLFYTFVPLSSPSHYTFSSHDTVLHAVY